VKIGALPARYTVVKGMVKRMKKKLTNRERKSAVNKLVKIREKQCRLSEQEKQLEKDMKAGIMKLAKQTCPFKRGQVFRCLKKNIHAKVHNVGGPSVMVFKSVLNNNKDYHKAPYQLECRRCDRKGDKTKKFDKWIYILGTEIGVEWELVE
jgi:hypothetical protein